MEGVEQEQLDLGSERELKKIRKKYKQHYGRSLGRIPWQEGQSHPNLKGRCLWINRPSPYNNPVITAVLQVVTGDELGNRMDELGHKMDKMLMLQEEWTAPLE